MKGMLFPFSFRRWIALGFVTWLATIGEGGCNFRTNFGPRDRGSGKLPDAVRHVLEAYWPIVLAGAVLAVLVGVGIWLGLLYLRSRGTFMYLDAVYSRDCRIRPAWRTAAVPALSFWKWSIVLALGALAAAGAAGIAMVATFIVAGGLDSLNVWTILAIVGFGLLVVLIALVFGAAGWLMTTLLAPIMYVRRCAVPEAWAEFRRLARGHVKPILLFFLMHIPLGLLVAVVAFPVICLTCCLAALPVIFQTIMQPFFLWLRGYGPHFLAQFGGAYAEALAPPAADTGPC